MGVHGLTTYLRESRTVLSHTLVLPQHLAAKGPAVPFVVDAWSFIYEIVHCANLPWVYGGEYPHFAWLVQHVVEAWLSVGLDLYFVFDGPYPALKFPTLVSRITKTQIQAGLLFFRTSSAARSAPRFLHDTAMLPPLTYSVCVDTLLRIAATDNRGRLHLHFADEEGDPYAVALAARLGAYVAGRDSDFVVLNAEGYQGYVPLDEMVWTAMASTAPWEHDGNGSVDSASVAAETEYGDDDGFQTVKKGRGRKKHKVQAGVQDTVAGRGILPPDTLPGDSDYPSYEGQQLSLTFTVYTPSTLAAHLGIPVSLLPLMGAILGNDFTGASPSDNGVPPPATTAEIRARGRAANIQRLFFDRSLSLSQRITRVANTLAGILASAFGSNRAAQQKRSRRKIGSVMDLIDASVTALLVRPIDTFATGEREAVVERIAEATLQYAIPKNEDVSINEGATQQELRWESDVCALHVPEACPLLRNLSRRVNERLIELDAASDASTAVELSEDDQLLVIRERYVAAYRDGVLDPHILDCARTGTTWPRMFLEDPDKECVTRSVSRPIRMWTYAILAAGVGLPQPPGTESVDGKGHEDEDEDELIDVEEENSDEECSGDGDPLARLRGALQELDGPEVARTHKIEENGDLSEAEDGPATFSNAGVQSVTEYVRRGSRLATENIPVRGFYELLAEVSMEAVRDPSTKGLIPPQAWSDAERRALLLRALSSDVPTVGALPNASRLMAVVAVRTIVRTMDTRARESGGAKERMAERWTHAEARAVLASLTVPAEGEATGEWLQEPVTERHVQLVAQVLAALDAIEQLAQVLLLGPTIRSPGRKFSGARCHGLLGGRVAVELEEEIWLACTEGLEEAFAMPPQRRVKAKKAKAAVATTGKSSKTGKGGGGMFGLLVDAEA